MDARLTIDSTVLLLYFVLIIAVGLYMAFTAPLDYQQGHAAKIMFVHVPAAWLSMFGYAMVAISSFGLLVFRHPLADVSAKAAAPIGATFTFLCLLTGSLWGKPMWGAFWVWDPRLTSVGIAAVRISVSCRGVGGEFLARRCLRPTRRDISAPDITAHR